MQKFLITTLFSVLVLAIVGCDGSQNTSARGESSQSTINRYQIVALSYDFGGPLAGVIEKSGAAKVAILDQVSGDLFTWGLDGDFFKIGKITYQGNVLDAKVIIK